MPEEEPIVSVEIPASELSERALSEAPPLEVPVEHKKEQVSERVGEKYAKILSQVATTQTSVASDEVATDAEALATAQEAGATVTRLVALAETKGVAHAVHVAQKLGDLYVLDTMHDKLADEFYEALRQKGLIASE